MKISSTQIPDLLPCPFCGSVDLETYESDIEEISVTCNYCRAVGPDHGYHDSTSREEAMLLWNSRAASPPMPDDVAEAIERLTTGRNKADKYVGGWLLEDIETLVKYAQESQALQCMLEESIKNCDELCDEVNKLRAASTPSAEVRALREALGKLNPYHPALNKTHTGEK